MHQRYNDLSADLCWDSAFSFFNGKWSRTDVLAFAEEISGVPREEIWRDRLNNNDQTAKIEVLENVSKYLLDLAEDIISGKSRDDVLPVKTESRYDNMSRKYRTIASLSIPHQLLGHLVKLGLQPLFDAYILPTQHASMPGRGQTRLVQQVAKYLRSDKLGIRYYQKTDVINAYGSIMYDRVYRNISELIPQAKWILTLIKYIGSFAPDGHLIIGGYLDAWLFNFMMSFALRFALKQGYYRRGKFVPYIIRIVTYMDDFDLLSRSKKGLIEIVPLMDEYMRRHIGVSIRKTTGIIRLLDREEEIRRRGLPKPAQRGCPGIDMAGYDIRRTHIILRKRVAKRMIRTFSRAYTEMNRTGTISLKRARSVTSRWGALKQTNNYKFCKKYHVHQILAKAKGVVRFHDRQENHIKKEWMRNAVRKYTERRYAEQSKCRSNGQACQAGRSC